MLALQVVPQLLLLEVLVSTHTLQGLRRLKPGHRRVVGWYSLGNLRVFFFYKPRKKKVCVFEALKVGSLRPSMSRETRENPRARWEC